MKMTHEVKVYWVGTEPRCATCGKLIVISTGWIAGGARWAHH